MPLFLINILNFLITTLFSVYIIAVMLRFLLQWVKADFYNPFCQLLIKLTNKPLIPLRRIIPGWFGLDLAAVVLMLLLQWIELALLALLIGYPLNTWLLLLGVVKLFLLLLNLYSALIIARAISSWFSQDPRQPMVILLHQLTEPLLAPVRRMLPSSAGIDFSPLIVLLILQVAVIGIQSVIGQ